MTTNKFNLEAIDGIQEIDDATAANCNGGFDIELFTHAGFPSTSGNDGLGTGRSVENLVDSNGNGNFNDRISSIRVNAGQWVVYEHANFRGQALSLGVGEYDIDFLRNQENFNFNDSISSIRRR